MVETQMTAKQLKRQAKLERKLQKRQRKEARRAEKLSQRVEVAYRSRLKTDEVVALLEGITEGLKNGSVQVEYDGQNVSISPTGTINVRVRARQTHKTERLSIRLGWPRDTTDNTEDIQISS